MPRLIMYLTRLPIIKIGNLDDVYMYIIYIHIFLKKKYLDVLSRIKPNTRFR